MSEHEDKTVPKEELTDFHPERVSIVDDGAVGDPFFVVKRKELEEMNDNAGEIKLQFYVVRRAKSSVNKINERTLFFIKALNDIPQDQLVDSASDVSPAIVAEVEKIRTELRALSDDEVLIENSVAADVEQFQAIQKAVLSTTIRDAIVKIMEGISERLLNLSTSLDDDSSATLEKLMYGISRLEWHMRSLADVAYTFKYLSDEYLENPDEIAKAKWTRAYMNDLPDSAFLYIESGGEKDSEGKTKPRSLRHFPVRDKDGKLDIPHIRNAIAQIPKAKVEGLSDDAKSKLQDKARKLLAQATKSQGKAVEKNVVADNDVSTDNVSEVEKAGKKISEARLKKLENLQAKMITLRDGIEPILKEMTELLEEVSVVEKTAKGNDEMATEEKKPEAPAAPVATTETPAVPVAKSNEQPAAPAAPVAFDPKTIVDEIVKRVTDQVEKNMKENEFLASIKKSLDDQNSRLEKIEKRPDSPQSSDGNTPPKPKPENNGGEKKEVFKSLFTDTPFGEKSK